MYDIGIKDLVKTMDETKLLNYLKGESDAEECLEVEAWYHASAEHKKQLDQLYYMLFVGERKVAMDGVDTENSLSVLKDRIKHKESEKKSVHRIHVSKWKRYAMPLAAFLCGLLVSVGALLDFLRKVGRIYFCYRIRAAGTGSFTGWNESMVECFNTDRL